MAQLVALLLRGFWCVGDKRSGGQAVANLSSLLRKLRVGRVAVAQVLSMKTRLLIERCVRALERKCEILWGLLDAVEAAHRRPRLAPHARLRDEDDGALVVLPERAVRVNHTGKGILGLCDGERTAEALACCMRERHPGEAGVEAHVHEFLAEMEDLGVLARPRPS